MTLHVDVMYDVKDVMVWRFFIQNCLWGKKHKNLYITLQKYTINETYGLSNES